MFSLTIRKKSGMTQRRNVSHGHFNLHMLLFSNPRSVSWSSSSTKEQKRSCRASGDVISQHRVLLCVGRSNAGLSRFQFWPLRLLSLFSGVTFKPQETRGAFADKDLSPTQRRQHSITKWGTGLQVTDGLFNQPQPDFTCLCLPLLYWPGWFNSPPVYWILHSLRLGHWASLSLQ